MPRKRSLQQRGVNFGGQLVDETIAMQDIEDRLPFAWTQRARRSAPRSRCWRQVIRCELYNPSRRSNAPSSPGFLHASASLSIAGDTPR